MAKASKPKKEEVVSEDSFVVNEPIETSEIIIEKIDIQPEIEFLTELLATQVDGKWHGPAAGLIRDRIKLLNS